MFVCFLSITLSALSPSISPLVFGAADTHNGKAISGSVWGDQTGVSETSTEPQSSICHPHMNTRHRWKHMKCFRWKVRYLVIASVIIIIIALFVHFSANTYVCVDRIISVFEILPDEFHSHFL